jgi:hypothetical protein
MEALRTGRTKTTRALDDLFGDPNALQHHAHLADLQAADALRRPLAEWVKTELRQRGLTDLELDHIDKWPDPLKEEVRRALVSAIANGQPVHFHWEMHRGDDEETPIQDPDPQGHITIIFRSPGRKLNVSGVTLGNVKVEV